MKRVYSSLNSLLVDNLYNLMLQQGIDCEVRNRHGSSMVGEIPISESFTELWVDDESAQAAEELIEQALEADEDGASAAKAWTCPTCGTLVDPPFDTCWKCAAEGDDRSRPDEVEPIFETVDRTLYPYGWVPVAVIVFLLCLWLLSR